MEGQIKSIWKDILRCRDQSIIIPHSVAGGYFQLLSTAIRTAAGDHKFSETTLRFVPIPQAVHLAKFFFSPRPPTESLIMCGSRVRSKYLKSDMKKELSDMEYQRPNSKILPDHCLKLLMNCYDCSMQNNVIEKENNVRFRMRHLVAKEESEGRGLKIPRQSLSMKR